MTLEAILKRHKSPYLASVLSDPRRVESIKRRMQRLRMQYEDDGQIKLTIWLELERRGDTHMLLDKALMGVRELP